ncbi:hypothetical protein, partial [Cryobacterium sp.]|uniref:hypothetical protein n=1 Tax=Cryobacterium sp. TaxID=1926290 RepID=UPI00260214D5
LPLAGCAEAATSAPTSSPPTPTPVFASDEEALAAATAAYANYLKLSSVVAHDGGADARRMSDVSTGEALETEIRSLEGMAEAGTVGVGELSYDKFTMQSAELSSGSLTAYVCLDVSATDVLDISGESVLSDSRVDRLPLEVAFAFDKDDQQLLVERTRIWDGDNFCSSP